MHAPSGIARCVDISAERSPSGPFGSGIPDWRDSEAYDWLDGADPLFWAWEWLRRDPDYRHEALANPPQRIRDRFGTIDEQRAASKWGLHAFEDPRRSWDARPLWLPCRDKSVLHAKAIKPRAERGIFALEELQDIVTLGVAEEECRLLLCDGLSAVRLDVEGHEVLASQVSLQFEICGFEAARQHVRTWERLAHLIRGQLLPPLSFSGVNARRRQLLLLRTFDALAEGASQRQIAAELIRPEAAIRRWRSVNPSLRSQAQRLVKGARTYAQGRFWSLLE